MTTSSTLKTQYLSLLFLKNSIGYTLYFLWCDHYHNPGSSHLTFWDRMPSYSWRWYWPSPFPSCDYEQFGRNGGGNDDTEEKSSTTLVSFLSILSLCDCADETKSCQQGTREMRDERERKKVECIGKMPKLFRCLLFTLKWVCRRT